MPLLVEAAGLQQEALHRVHIGQGDGRNGASLPGLRPPVIPQPATQQPLDGVAGHPVIQRQHPGGDLGIRQQGLQASALGQGRHHRLLHQDQGDGACQRLLQHRQMQQ
ncbi:hypothetical protein D3C73_1387920 [compost metagenome]